jgi:pimeloyl-ACP methyl ester carboxylesterase
MANQRDATSGYAEVNGARLSYEVAGAGHPLIMIHAGIANMHYWDDQWEPFSHAYRVVRFDIRGYGQSVMPPGPYDVRADVYALMRTLGIDHAYLMGASIGGGIVIDFALEHPEMVDALIPVVSGLSGGPEPSEEELRQWKAVEEAMDAAREAGNLDLIDEITARLWVDGPTRTPEQVDPAVRARVLQMLRDNRDAAGAEGTPTRTSPTAYGRLGDIHVPTLVIAGDIDLPEIMVSTDLIVAGIPGARKAVMQGVAHAPNMERPEEFNRLVLDFVRAVDAAS